MGAAIRGWELRSFHFTMIVDSAGDIYKVKASIALFGVILDFADDFLIRMYTAQQKKNFRRPMARLGFR